MMFDKQETDFIRAKDYLLDRVGKLSAAINDEQKMPVLDAAKIEAMENEQHEYYSRAQNLTIDNAEAVAATLAESPWATVDHQRS